MGAVYANQRKDKRCHLELSGDIFSLGSQVIWLPVLIHYLPPDILGLWYVFVSIGGLVELMDSGFTPTLSHCMTYA